MYYIIKLWKKSQIIGWFLSADFEYFIEFGVFFLLFEESYTFCKKNVHHSFDLIVILELSEKEEDEDSKLVDGLLIRQEFLNWVIYCFTETLLDFGGSNSYDFN